jgi:hypothetical protein
LKHFVKGHFSLWRNRKSNMKYLIILFWVLVGHSLSHGQAITSYQLTDIGNGTLKVGSVFDADEPSGKLIQDNSTISLLIPTGLITNPPPIITSLQGGDWAATAIIPNATLLTVCGAAATGYDLIQVSTLGQATLGPVVAGVPEDLFTITFTGSSDLPIYAYDPTGADPLSTCLAEFGVDNVASIDPDGNGGEPTANYSNIPASPGVVLPIELSVFTAQPLNTTDVQLNWTTASEINSSHFDIERSNQGISWENIGTVAAAGNSQSNLYYSLIDQKVFDPNKPTETNFYYRLKMVDHDGYFEYSVVRQVRFETIGLFVGDPFPNPSGLGNASIQLPVSVKVETNLQIIVYDNQGRIVSTNARSLHVGYNNLTIGTGTLPLGVYYMKLSMENGASFVRKLVVQ